MAQQPEPWLRGALDGVPSFAQPLFHSFAQVREDLARWTEGLTTDQVWREVAGTSLGFQLKHLAGSADRLATYLVGEQLSEGQLRYLHAEHTRDLNLLRLMQQVHQMLEHAENRVLTLRSDQLFEPRSVGRRQLPSTVSGLLTHIAEHTQRHLGQAILIAKLVRHHG